MIRFNWKRRSDGEPLARVRVEHLLTRDDMARLLVARKIPTYRDQLEDMTSAEVEEAVRFQLSLNPDAANWWADNYREYGDEDAVSEQEALEWAKRQVAKLRKEEE